MSRSIVLLLCVTLTAAQYSGSSSSKNKQRPPPNYKNNLPKFSDNVGSPLAFDSQKLPLPGVLPIQAPNGVIEIYNRVVDDLVKRLENDFKKRSIDPLGVIIRPTPPGPVRVPGRLQKRPFRGPGAPLYRQGDTAVRPLRKQRDVRSTDLPTDSPFPTDAGKIADSTSSVETTPAPAPREAISSESDEIDSFLKSRSDELFPDEDEKKTRKNEKKKKDTVEEELDDSEEDKRISTKDITDLIQKYQNTNSREKNNGVKKVKPTLPTIIKKLPTIEPENDDDENDEESPDDYHEPSTGTGSKPQVGFKQQGGPPAIPAKPNAQLMGLSKIKRSSDVSVTVDARSAVIRARLLVGPFDVYINESIEPQEKNVRASIPQLEAEMLLMERHGVIFLQRFTLDRVYGQDVEINIAKALSKLGEKTSSSSKGTKGSKKGSPVQPTGGFPQPSHPDPNHASNAQQRFQTKMAAHVSMEIVHILRSGKLRADLLRVAQESISKLTLPIQKRKNPNQGKKNGAEGEKEEE